MVRAYRETSAGHYPGYKLTADIPLATGGVAHIYRTPDASPLTPEQVLEIHESVKTPGKDLSQTLQMLGMIPITHAKTIAKPQETPKPKVQAYDPFSDPAYVKEVEMLVGKALNSPDAVNIHPGVHFGALQTYLAGKGLDSREIDWTVRRFRENPSDAYCRWITAFEKSMIAPFELPKDLEGIYTDKLFADAFSARKEEHQAPKTHDALPRWGETEQRILPPEQAAIIPFLANAYRRGNEPSTGHLGGLPSVEMKVLNRIHAKNHA